MTKKENKTIDDIMQNYLECLEGMEITGNTDGYNVDHILDRIDALMAFLNESGNKEEYEYYQSMTDSYFKKYWGD